MTDHTRSATPFQVAALQMVSTPDVARNLAEARRLIAEAAGERAARAAARVFLLHGPPRHRQARARRKDGPIQRFADAARHHGVWVIGTLPLKAPEPDRVLNTTLVFDPSGNEAARYDKIHLFNFEKGDESFDEARPRGRYGRRVRRAVRAGRPVGLLRSPLSGAVSQDGRLHADRRTVGVVYDGRARTGKRCCARGPSRTSATCSRPRRRQARNPAHLGPAC